MKIVSFVLFVSLVVGCSTDNSSITSAPELNYVQGEVGFGLKDTVSLMDLANYIYSLDSISIKEVVSFQYSAFLPQDSMQIIKSTLETKSYIWTGTVRTSYGKFRSFRTPIPADFGHGIRINSDSDSGFISDRFTP